MYVPNTVEIHKKRTAKLVAISHTEVLDQIGGTVKARMILSGYPRTSCTRESKAKAPLGEQCLSQKMPVPMLPR